MDYLKELTAYADKYGAIADPKKMDIEDYRQIKILSNKIYTVTLLNLMNTDIWVGDVIRELAYKCDTTLQASAAVSMNREYKLVLSINPLFMTFTCKNYDQVSGVFEHETIHILNNHLVTYRRYLSSVPQVAVNIAFDCSVNQFVRNSLPDGVVTLDWFRQEFGKDAEAKRSATYYLKFVMDPKNKKLIDKLQQQLDSMKKSDVLLDRSHSQWESAKKNNDLNEIKNRNKILSDISKNLQEMKKRRETESKKSRGLDSLGEDSIYSIHKDKAHINWKSIIAKKVGLIKNGARYTHKRVNRQVPYNPRFAGKIANRTIRLIAIMDTSGSITEEDLNKYFAEINAITKLYKANLTVIQSDSEVQKVDNIKENQKVEKFAIKGNGGTSFIPAIEYCSVNNLSGSNTLVVYFTDGYGEEKDEFYSNNNTAILNNFDKGKSSSQKNLIWVVTSKDGYKLVKSYQYGKTLLLDDEEN